MLELVYVAHWLLIGHANCEVDQTAQTYECEHSFQWQYDTQEDCFDNLKLFIKETMSTDKIKNGIGFCAAVVKPTPRESA